MSARRQIRAHALAVVAAAAASSSCFVVTDLGRFHEAEVVDSNFTNLQMTVHGFDPHVSELFEYRVVDSANVIQSRGVIRPLGGPDETFKVEGAVPKQNGPFHLDFYADYDNSGDYDNKRPDVFVDHSWRLPLTDALLSADTSTFVVVFQHNTSFTDLNTPAPPTVFGVDVTVHLQNLAPLQGKRVEVRVSDASSKRVTAMYRVPMITTLAYDAVVKGMAEAGVTYTIEVYTDDGKSTPASIRAWRFQTVATPTALETTFDGTNPTAPPPPTPAAVAASDAEPAPTL